MKSEKETLEQLSAVSDVKMSPQIQQEIWNNIEEELNETKPKRTKRHLDIWGTGAAAVAAVILVAGGYYAVSTHKLGIPSHSTTASHTTKPNISDYASEIAVIKSKGYVVTTKQPNASVKTDSGATFSAWICILSASQDGHNQRVLFFLNGKYVGIDAKPSLEISSAQAAGAGSIAVTYPVYKSTDSLANPTGTPVTITYTWNGSKLVPNKQYPKQFV